MSEITVKFGIGDVFYTFDSDLGIISRHVVDSIRLELSHGGSNSSVIYTSISGRQSFLEYEAYTEQEIRQVANNWLLEKSISIFAVAGL